MALYFPPIGNFIADGTTEEQFKAALASLHAVVAELNAGQSYPAAVFFNPSQINADASIPAGHNGQSAGPITIADGVTFVIPEHSTWSIT